MVDYGVAENGDDEDSEHLYIALAKAVASIRKVHVNWTSVYSQDRGASILILDNGAEVSIFRDKNLFFNLSEVDPICVDGVDGGSEGIYTSTAGDTRLGKAYFSPRVMGNILSFGDCVDFFHKVSYDEASDSFELQAKRGGRLYVFRRAPGSKLYTCDISQSKRVIVETVRENMAKYSKREVARAREAKEYQRRMGIVTAGELIKLLAAGKIRNSDISVQDVVRSVDIWGKDLANLKGKTTAKKAPILQLDSNDAEIRGLIQRDQVMLVDIMYVNSSIYLLSIFMPSGYTDIKKLKARSHSELLRAIKGGMEFMVKAGFNITLIRSDGESAVDSDGLKDKLSVEVDVTGGESLPIVERKIRTLKERFRGAINTLPYNLTTQLEDWLLQHCNYFLNFAPGANSLDKRSAREKVKGRLINAKTDLRHGFGDYVQISDQETSNSMEERTRGAIALMPVGNAEGSWYYLVLKTWSVIKRNHAEPLPVPDEVIDYINAKVAEQDGKKKKTKQNEGLKMGLFRPNRDAGAEDFGSRDDLEEENDELGAQLPEEFVPDYEAQELVAADDYIEEDLLLEEPINTPVADFDEVDDAAVANEEAMQDSRGAGAPEHEEDVAEQAEAMAESAASAGGGYSFRPKRSLPGRWRGVAVLAEREIESRYGLKMTIRQAVKKIGYKAVLSVVKEITQLLDMGTFEGVDISKLSEAECRLIISSSLFLKDKYTPQGVFDKLKSRLVAGGHQQDREIYNNGASPTASTTSLFIMMAIAASERRAVATIDFPGAFLHSEMPDDGKPVFMRLNKFETKVVVSIDKSYVRFVRKDGTMIVKLKRALYGCVESARLWYEKLSKDLESIGYVRNKVDMCVFNRIEEDGSQSSLIVHVDDVFISANSEATIDKIISDISGIYPSLEIHRGRVLDYLGMTFDFTEVGKCAVTMHGYVSDLMEFCESITGVAQTPAGNNLFRVREDSPLLPNADSEFFHSLTAKLLYLGKRVRPEILTAISYLTKRVLSPTMDDMHKLHRVVRYIRGTQHLGIVLQADKYISVIGYVDASYGVHSDMRSHTGIVIGIGKGPVFAKSSSQKINTKSSAESELVGLSDSAGHFIGIRNFLIEQGYVMAPAKIYQDNQSAIALVRNGKSNSERTRHIAIRFFFIADRINSKEIEIEYMKTGEMLADILTKPLQGELFRKLRSRLLNWDA